VDLSELIGKLPRARAGEAAGAGGAVPGCGGAGEGAGIFYGFCERDVAGIYTWETSRTYGQEV